MKVFTLAEKSAWITRRIAEGVVIPPPEQLRNSGARRTAEKRALLARLEELAREQGREPPFPASR